MYIETAIVANALPAVAGIGVRGTWRKARGVQGRARKRTAHLYKIFEIMMFEIMMFVQNSCNHNF